MKLSPKFYGTFQVTDNVEIVAYKLTFPTTSRMHVGTTVTTTSLPSEVQDTTFHKEGEAILDRIIAKWRSLPITKILRKWKHHLPEDVT